MKFKPCITDGPMSAVPHVEGQFVVSKSGQFRVDTTDEPSGEVNFGGGGSENAVTAEKLATARNIGGVPFDGTADINLPGVNAAGNQNTTGNAATATKLATARNIGGVAFDGTAAINLPGVNAAGTQNTTGTAGNIASYATTAPTATQPVSTAVTATGTVHIQNLYNYARWLDTNKTGAPSFTAVAATGPTANASPAFGGTFTVPQVSQAANGQLTATARTITLPAAPTTITGAAWTTSFTPTTNTPSTPAAPTSLTGASHFAKLYDHARWLDANKAPFTSTTLTAAADLNDYVTEGRFKLTATMTYGMANMPVTLAAQQALLLLDVVSGTVGNSLSGTVTVVRQTLTMVTHSNNVANTSVYVRTRRAGTWGGWQIIPAYIEVIQELNTTLNFNSFVTTSEQLITTYGGGDTEQLNNPPGLGRPKAAYGQDTVGYLKVVKLNNGWVIQEYQGCPTMSFNETTLSKVWRRTYNGSTWSTWA